MDQADLDGHKLVFDEAIGLYVARSESYGQVWRNYGALSNLLSAARKVDRTMEYWWHSDGVPLLHKDALDDALDAINYMTLFIRNVRDMNITGHTPERPDGGLRVVGNAT